MNLIVN